MTTTDEMMKYLGAQESDRDFVAECLKQATTLIACYIGETEVPEDIWNNSEQQVASELFHRRSAPSGIAQFSSVDGVSPYRVAKDPMTSVYPILRRWVVSGV